MQHHRYVYIQWTSDCQGIYFQGGYRHCALLVCLPFVTTAALSQTDNNIRLWWWWRHVIRSNETTTYMWRWSRRPRHVVLGWRQQCRTNVLWLLFTRVTVLRCNYCFLCKRCVMNNYIHLTIDVIIHALIILHQYTSYYIIKCTLITP